MTPDQIETILGRLDRMDEQYQRGRAEILDWLRQIEEHARHTNGRVSGLELAQERRKGHDEGERGAKATIGRVIVGSATVGASVSAVAVAFVTQL